MKLKLKNTPEQVELIKAIGSRDANVSREASEAFAAFLGPVIEKVLLTAGTASQIYVDSAFDEDDSPSYPLDLYHGEGAGHVSVWSQHMAGGLPTSHVEGMQEIKIATYRLDSAVSFNKRYARRARLDVVSKALERMANEVLIKQERNAWAVILKALADAKTGSLLHVLNSDAHLKFGLADLNNLMTRAKRINESFSGHTPIEAFSNGVTDLYVSPEIKAQIRAFAYNPINTSGADTTGATSRNQTLSDDVRSDIYRSAGMQSIYGVNIVEMVEFGAGKKYNVLFDEMALATTDTPDSGDNLNDVLTDMDGSGTNWAKATNQVLVGVDNTRGAFIRPVSRGHDYGSGSGTFTALPDEQFNMYGNRVEKTGFYGFLEEGRICIDARAIMGLVV
jgi:hypothetical protein